MGGLEWIIIELLVVGLLGWEWVRIRREIRRDKEAKPPPPES